MPSIALQRHDVIVGVDTHKDEHIAVAGPRNHRDSRNHDAVNQVPDRLSRPLTFLGATLKLVPSVLPCWIGVGNLYKHFCKRFPRLVLLCFQFT